MSAENEPGYCSQHNTVCVAQARYEVKVDGLQETVDEIKKQLDGLRTDIKTLTAKIDKRPSWLTSMVITILTSLLLALIVYVITGGR